MTNCEDLEIENQLLRRYINAQQESRLYGMHVLFVPDPEEA